MIALQTSGTLPDWTALAPAILLGLTALTLFLIDSVDPNDESPGLLAGVATLGSVLAMVVTGWYLVSGTGMPRTGGPIELFSGQLVVDGMSLFFTFIFTSVAALVTLQLRLPVGPAEPGRVLRARVARGYRDVRDGLGKQPRDGVRRAGTVEPAVLRSRGLP